MGKGLFIASRTEDRRTASTQPSDGQGETQQALELVAVRGEDVIGVRHLLRGAKAWVGQAPDSIAPISMVDFGGQPCVVAEAAGRRFVLRVPPRARARSHGKDGLGRLAIGPIDLPVDDGDRMVIVLGDVQIRARLVPLELASAVPAKAPSETKRWMAAMGGIYVAALAVCALIAPSRPSTLDGHMRRAVSTMMETTATPQLAAETTLRVE
jgi:hypothetical protein